MYSKVEMTGKPYKLYVFLNTHNFWNLTTFFLKIKKKRGGDGETKNQFCEALDDEVSS